MAPMWPSAWLAAGMSNWGMDGWDSYEGSYKFPAWSPHSEGVVSLQGSLSVNHFQFLVDSVGTNSSAYVQGLYFLKIHEID